MPPLPRITSAELAPALERDGWYFKRQSGSHAVFGHPSKPGRVVVPMHAGKIIPPGILSDFLKDASLTADELRALL